MKVTITTYKGNPFAADFPSRKTEEFTSVDEIRREFQPATDNIHVKAPLLTSWLTIEDGDNQGTYCWLDEFLEGKDFHRLEKGRHLKEGEQARILGENEEWPYTSPKDGITLAPGYWISLYPHHDLPAGKYFIITPTGVTAWAEYKKPKEGNFEQLALKILTTSLD